MMRAFRAFTAEKTAAAFILCSGSYGIITGAYAFAKGEKAHFVFACFVGGCLSGTMLVPVLCGFFEFAPFPAIIPTAFLIGKACEWRDKRKKAD